MKIHWITEAFNMQPATYSIGQSIMTRTSNGDISKIEVAEIKLETTSIEGDPFEFYKGYDKDGNLLFEFRKGTVNVGYF